MNVAAPPTKDRILDSAETLFGLNGFDTISLRDITTHAGVNLAAVNYHFQSKESLIAAVIGRRVEPINRQRLEMLAAAGQNPSVEQIVEAFIRPVLELQLGPIMPLVGRVLAEPRVRESLFRSHLSAIAQVFREAFGRALPEMPQVEVLWRQQFVVGTMTHLLCWGPSLPSFTDGLCHLEDREAVIERAVIFLAAGFRAALPSSTSKPAWHAGEGIQ